METRSFTHINYIVINQSLKLSNDFCDENILFNSVTLGDNEIYLQICTLMYTMGRYGKTSTMASDHSFGLMLNLDWFQPFQHVKYSIGVIYAVVLNLPRHLQFKLENVILIGIIPDMGKEPSTNTFVKPLVNELEEA